MITLRDNVLDYLDANPVTGFTVSQELPWSNANKPLVLKNKTTIYVDNPTSIQEPLFDTLDGGGAVNETYTVQVVVATDAKNLPDTYNDMWRTVKNARLTDRDTLGVTQRLTTVDREYIEDVLVTTFNINFTKFICS